MSGPIRSATPEIVQSMVTAEQFIRPPGTTLTICVLTLTNGFTVTGESACVDPAKFDDEIGCNLARADAFNKVWMLAGFLSRQRAHDAAQGDQEAPKRPDALKIAKVCHEVNRAYCAAMGDESQLPWEAAPDWQQDSALAGVHMHLENPDATPEDSHRSWLKVKEAEGWAYGEVKDPAKKVHPCMVPYDQLPIEQRAKDYLFRAVVHAMDD